MNTDKHYLMDLKISELKTDNQRQVFYRYLQIAEHHIFTENKKEGIKINSNFFAKAGSVIK